MKKTFTLTQLAESVRRMFGQNFGEQAYWVSCELLKLTIKNGHYYLELADSKEGIHTAQMKAVIWRSQVLALQTNLGNEFKELLQPGNRLLFRVSLVFHEIYGLSLTIHDLDPAYTYGEIELKKKQTIERLQKEGLFDLQRQLVLPLIIKRIVLIGSPDTSGYRDFLSEMSTNPIFRNFTIKEIATSVQGDRAANQIIGALQEADTYDADAIVLLRGGGSKMDLNVFNDYELCKCVAQLRLPLLTGIGHETDEVVVDLVAHTRQITPTAVAKFLYLRIGTFLSELQTNLDRSVTQVLTQLAVATESLTKINLLLTHYFQTVIAAYRSILELSMNSGVAAALHYVRIVQSTELPGMMDRVHLNAKNQLDLERLKLNGVREKFEFLNPLKLLKAGYTMSSIENIDLSKFQGDYVGKELVTRTDRLVVYSTITKIQKEP